MQDDNEEQVFKHLYKEIGGMSLRISLGTCSGCGDKDVPIVNKKYGVCNTCNRERRGTPRPTSTFKQSTFKAAHTTSSGLKGGRIKVNKKKTQAAISRDEAFYEEVWNERDHNCEECGIFLGDRFRDDDGKVIDRFRYSHILGKGAYPMFRHRKENINLVCLKDHDRWAKQDKTMKLMDKNRPVIEELMKELH